ncbi:helix-turn-helix domain-containing protein [Streptomyces yaizuensis]|uniref:Helix-turn-helix domain-containing protein n=1 Tax=Streptomyces yaizuensis TaxID=2989713 RepID=A0ABQ5P5M3_9ACTN|nr:helix-turn-helix domain-containing protein [Streptomyces sp. YSPA8]GLF97852.1 helix-turn-helix domain-containing protein [Streptomyces sp. YSPA8]
MYEERPSRLPGAVVWEISRSEGRPVLPDGCMDLIWTPGDLFVAGPDTRAHPGGDRPPGARYAGVRLAPGTAPALLGVPAHELRDRRVPLADLRGAARARSLTARLDAAPDPVTALERIVLRAAADAPEPPDPLIAEVVRRLAEGTPVAVTAAAVGLGERRLHRRSLHAFGYGPKTLARVLRLQRALALIRRGTPHAVAAAAVGCADQAHLARETRALAGTTLSAYAASLPAPAGSGEASAKRETPRPSGSRTTA